MQEASPAACRMLYSLGMSSLLPVQIHPHSLTMNYTSHLLYLRLRVQLGHSGMFTEDHHVQSHFDVCTVVSLRPLLRRLYGSGPHWQGTKEKCVLCILLLFWFGGSGAGVQVATVPASSNVHLVLACKSGTDLICHEITFVLCKRTAFSKRTWRQYWSSWEGQTQAVLDKFGHRGKAQACKEPQFIKIWI